MSTAINEITNRNSVELSLDEASGKARYSWDYQYIDDPTMSGVINISFSGNQLVITEYLDREGYDEYTSGYEGYIQYFMSEVK